VYRRLFDRIDAERSQRKKKGALVEKATSETDGAKAARERLVARMRRFAGEREQENKALDEALGSIASDEELGRSIKGLVTLAQQWLARTDAASLVLLASAKLTKEVVAEALAAGTALMGAAADATEDRTVGGRDSAAVNVSEGAVLYEMRYALDAVGEAHEEHRAIRKLVPGPATRGVLGPRKGKRDAGKDAEAPEGGADGGGGAP
jgi:hypothetical protein